MFSADENVMTPADHFSRSETPFLGKPPEHRCPACEALDLEAEALIRKTKAAQARAEAWKQKALAQEAERDRLLGLLFSSPPQKT